MNGHLTALVDQERIELFALLAGSRRLFQQAQTWVDDQGIAWIGIRLGEVGIALTWLGPGWLFDPLAQQERAEDYEARLRSMRQANQERHERRLAKAVTRLRLGGHAERLLWAIHAAVREAGSSLLTLSDRWLGQMVWGTQEPWPRHWHNHLLQTLRCLSLLHVARWQEDDPPPFGPGTALLNHVGDLRGFPEDRCDDRCPHNGVQRHHHVRVEIGPAFLGILEQFGKLDTESGIRTYTFPRGGPKFEGASLWAVGKTGNLAPVFLPAKLGEPAACAKMTADQHRLLQAIVRETTRAKRKSRKEVSEAETFTGNSIRSFHGGKLHPCSLLDPGTRYVGFNGNGKRKGQGYLLASEGGWLAKAGYAVDVVDTFLDDLTVLAELLGLIVVGVGHDNLFVDIKALQVLAATPAGRWNLRRLHVRVYTAADYLERWSGIFHGEGSKATCLTPLTEGMAILLATMKRKKISQRKLADGVRKDHSFLSKLFKGEKPWPIGLLEQVQRWLDQQEEPQARSCSTPTCSGRKKTRSQDASLLSLALALLRRGWSVVPQLPGAKKPCVKWKPYQDRLPTEEEWIEWASRWPGAGLALVLGPVSGIFVIDGDGQEAHRALLQRLGKEPLAPKVLSGSGKPYRYHLYFRCPDLSTKAKQTPWHPQLEFRGKGGIVVIPPSLHKSGNRYTWAKGQSPDDLDLPDVPPLVLEALKPVLMKRPLSVPSIRRKLSVTGIDASPRTLEFLSGQHADGPRWNDRLFNAACDLCGRDMPVEKAEPLLLAGAQPWNQGEAESALRTIRSAYSQPREPARK